jgi:hypothetical protein
MSYSNWLSDNQLWGLLNNYFAGAYHEDDWPQRLKALIKNIQDDVLKADALGSLTDQALVERLLPIYKEVVRVPMYYKAITTQPERVPAALQYLLTSDDDLEQKVNAVLTSRGMYYIKGLGKTFWSIFFMALDPQQNPYWSNRTEKALNELGMATWSSQDSPGQVYRQIVEAECRLAELHPGASLYGIDHFVNYVTAGE